MPSFKTPTQTQIDTAVQRMRSPELAAYFLSRLENPLWVVPLRDKGLFESPPPSITDENNSLRFPHWPASKYLVRMAIHVPSEVASIFATFQTDNGSVIGDMLKAALKMPADVGAKLVPVVCQAVSRQPLWVYFSDSIDLCVLLAEGGKVSEAMQLTDALFAKLLHDGEAPGRREGHFYKDGLKKLIPIIVNLKPREFIKCICEVLNALILERKTSDLESESDLSYMWRPAIEEHEQNRDYDFAGVMVGFVRESIELAIQGGRLSLADALKIIEEYKFLIYTRLRIHLVGEFDGPDNELTRKIILNPNLLDDYEVKHEYAMLIGKRLNLLSLRDRELWLGWIDAGPVFSMHGAHNSAGFGPDDTVSDQGSRIRYWKFEKLHWARKHLDEDRKKLYEELLKDQDEPERANLSVHTVSRWTGRESPMSVHDLEKLTFEQATGKVSEWKPEKSRYMGPSVEGLASTFKNYVATNPQGFSSHSRVLVAKPAIYVRSFLDAVSEAIKVGQEIDVIEVLELCRWVIERPIPERTTPVQEQELIVDKDWQWTRDQISVLIENICNATTNGQPTYSIECRQPIWKIIHALYRDRSQSYMVHDISKDDPRVRDYLNHGVNSPRGKAVEAALEYARWIASHLTKGNDEQRLAGGFGSIPEVQEMLDWQIAPGNRTYEALALIGSRLGLICWIDKSWLATNAGKVFSSESVEAGNIVAEGWAAWNAFLVWVRPHQDFFELFKDQFEYAVAQSAQVKIPERSLEQPMYHLGEHLMILYGRGILSLDNHSRLLMDFLSSSNPDIRRHAVGFVGRSLENEEKLPEEIVSRFKSLWEVYWAGTGKNDAKEAPTAWLFGTWFSCGHFPPQWALERLEEFVEFAPIPEPDHDVIKHLEKIAQTNLLSSVRILSRMIRNDREGWRAYEWQDSAMKILKMTITAEGEAKRESIDLIDYLGRRGYSEYGILLKS